MDKGKRQKRLIQKVRNTDKWVRREKLKVKQSGSARFTDDDWKNAKIAANHGKTCSCAICCNPRHSSFSNGQTRLTIQERKQNERVDEDSWEDRD